jgi:hypothetical protein
MQAASLYWVCSGKEFRTVSFHHTMATKHPLESDEVGSAHNRGSESVTMAFVFWGALRSTTSRRELDGAGVKTIHT